VQLCYNIDTRLRKFFPDPKGFRKLQGQCGALLGEGFARAFIGNTKTPRVLTIYVGLDDDTTKLKEYIGAEGYHKDCFGYDEGMFRQSLGDFCKNGGDGGGIDNLWVLLRRQLHDGSPLNIVLNNAPTTASLNFVAWNKAYSLCPRQTYLKKETHRLHKLENPFRHQINKELLDEGFTNLMVHPERNNDSFVGVRRVGDKHTLIHDLDTTGITFNSDEMLPVPDNVIETATFKLCRRDYYTDEWFCTGAICGRIHYRVHARSYFAHGTLKHIYTTPAGDSVPTLSFDEFQPPQLFPHDAQVKFQKAIYDLYREFDELTQKEWTRTKSYPQVRRDSWTGGPPAHVYKWGKGKEPEGWRYFDNKLVQDLDRLWEEYSAEREEEQKDHYSLRLLDI
jgi:hypothetical protein